jgi:hypothetical protein
MSIPNRVEILKEALRLRMNRQFRFDLPNTPENYELLETGEYEEAKLALMRKPEVSVDAVIEDGLLDIPQGAFKKRVRKLWKTLSMRDDFKLELAIVQCLREDNNGGLRVESIHEKLLKNDIFCGYALIRETLGRLCKLYAVEHQHGQFSVRYGLIDLEE